MSTRLYPLTKQTPKALVPIAGEPNVAHILRYLRLFGVEEIAINIHYLGDQVEKRLGTGHEFGVVLNYLREKDLTGSAGCVRQMASFLDETFVVIGCDDLTDLRLDVLLDFHTRRGAIATIALVESNDVSHYGVVAVDEHGAIQAFQEKPKPSEAISNLVNTGVYIFDPKIFDYMPEPGFYDWAKDVFPRLLADKQPFYGLHMHMAYWNDIGTPDAYRHATADILNGDLVLPGARPRGIPEDTKGLDELKVVGQVRVGSGCRFGYGCTIIGPASIGDKVVVGDDVVIERSIIWDGVQIGPGARVTNAIVGAGYRVKPKAEIQETLVALGEEEEEPALRG
jgi:NDP-sugar pyrophosphorylase family protein